MVGRASAFADVEVIRLASRDFVPVVGDDWYQRRRQDDEGRFFRAVSDQSTRKASRGTRQGIYCLTADGHLLAFKNAGNSVEATRDQLRRALAEWSKLPAERTRPGAVAVPESFEPDPRYHREKPAGGLTVRVYSRILDRTADGFAAGSCSVPGGDKAGRDVLWLTAADLVAFAPPRAEVGASHPVPPAVASRLTRYHLLDNTRGEPPPWRPEEVRRADFRLTVTGVDAAGVSLRLDGDALMCDDPDPAKAERGFEVRLAGRLRYDPSKRTLTGFEVAALGEHWGEAGANQGARPGRSLVGLAFGLADGTKPLDGIPPQGVRDRDEYLGKR